MRIAIGSDHKDYELKEAIKKYIDRSIDQIEVKYNDFGTHSQEPVDYPDIACKVAEAVALGEYDRGILICGTGIGMAIAANKVYGIRAAQCYDIYSAERAMKSNDARILTLGALVTGPELAKKIVSAWLFSEYEGGYHIRKIDKIKKIEQKYRKER